MSVFKELKYGKNFSVTDTSVMYVKTEILLNAS